MSKRTHAAPQKPKGEQHLSPNLWQQVLDAIKKLDSLKVEQAQTEK